MIINTENKLILIISLSLSCGCGRGGMIMDSVFNDPNILCYIMHNLASTYICLWSYLPNGCLYLKDGYYRDEEASSSGSRASTLFHQYRQQVFVLGPNDLVPGFAFQNSLPYMEINELDLLRMASSDIQRQFYQEARIKKAVFMGCKSGEIELGFSHVNAPINMEMEMRSLFPQDFSRPVAAAGDPLNIKPRNSSSSPSSFRSLSTEPETAPIAIITTTATTMSTTEKHQLPTVPENEQAEMIRAILAVLSSPSPTSLPQQQNPQKIQLSPLHQNPKATAFKRYTRPSSTGTTNQYMVRPNMLKRSISYFRNLHIARMHERAQANYRPSSSNQLHHVISERKRREKLNESFQALRSLLPPGSKKDKASVLAGAREYLASLKAQVEEMSERNRILEANLLAANKESELEFDDDDEGANLQERVDVQIVHVAESTSSDEGLMVELRVMVRSEMAAVEVVVRILEFLKQLNNVSLVSMEANRRITDSTAVNRVNLRLKIQGIEWDESGFREAVKRVLNG